MARIPQGMGVMQDPRTINDLIPDDKVQEICSRVYELVEINQPQQHTRMIIRAIMNGGSEAVSQLLSERMGQRTNANLLPVANHIVGASQRMGQKLGRRPDVKVDPPITSDSDRARANSERKARIVENYDRAAKLRLQLPQMGRWLPGYGFTPFVIEPGRDENNQPYPRTAIRDPYTALPSEWNVNQQPEDIAFIRSIGVKKLSKMFPEHENRFRAQVYGQNVGFSTFGRYYDLSTSSNQPTWENQARNSIEVYEYINEEGTWWVQPEANLLLSFIPNPLEHRPPFQVAKRFAFDRLVGHYDHAIGLMSAVARLNLLLMIAVEDNVNAETNIIGEVEGQYKRGRGEINFLSPGSTVDKSTFQIPHETFQQATRLEQQLRDVASYPITDDARSPNSWVTGAGMEELHASLDAEIQEYFLVIQDTLEELDSRRLEWDEKMYGHREKSIHGVRKDAAFAEKYTPRIHVKGNYVTRRVYGAMAALDENNKIIQALNLMQANVIDLVTVREQIDGLEDHTEIERRIRWQQAEATLFEWLQAMAAGEQQPDPRIIKILKEMLPPGEVKDIMDEVFPDPEEEEEGLPDLAQMMEEQQPDPMADLAAGGGLPDSQAVLQRLTAGEGGVSPTLGVQAT